MVGKGFDARDAQIKRHKRLLAIVVRKPEDYRPYGALDHKSVNGGWGRDCSMGCKHALALPEPYGSDWVVCTNEQSHRCGLLTFEHQGCPKFEGGANRWHDEQPESVFGFTRDDVKLLRGAAYSALLEVARDGEESALAEDALALARRIAALLPPEEATPTRRRT